MWVHNTNVVGKEPVHTVHSGLITQVFVVVPTKYAAATHRREGKNHISTPMKMVW